MTTAWEPNWTLPALSPDDQRHGTENGYVNLRCRCDRCREAHATYYREGPGLAMRRRHAIDSGLFKRRYRLARNAGYSAKESRRRQFWSDPLADRSVTNGDE